MPLSITRRIGGAMYVGDKNDASNVAFKLARYARVLRFKESRGI